MKSLAGVIASARTTAGSIVGGSGSDGSAGKVESGLVMWLDASRTSSMFTDTTLLTPVTTDTQSVAAWTDLTGNVNHVIQGTGTSQPTYRSALGPSGKAAVFFDGTDDFLGANVSFPNTFNVVNGVPGFTVIVVASYAAAGLAQPAFFASTASSTTTVRFLAQRTPGGLLSASANRNAVLTVTTPNANPGNNTWVVSAHVASNTINTIDVYNNNVLGGTVAWADSPGASFVSVGSLAVSVGNQSTAFMSGYISEVLVYNRGLSSAEVGTMVAYARSKWGF